MHDLEHLLFWLFISCWCKLLDPCVVIARAGPGSSCILKMTSLAIRQALLSLLLDLTDSFFPLTFDTLWTLFRRSKLRNLAISSSLNLTSMFENFTLEPTSIGFSISGLTGRRLWCRNVCKKIKPSHKRARLSPSLFTWMETVTHPPFTLWPVPKNSYVGEYSYPSSM